MSIGLHLLTRNTFSDIIFHKDPHAWPLVILLKESEGSILIWVASSNGVIVKLN